jgi:tRNA-splicing ligase RtcB
MPDLHLGRLANNGTAVATETLVYPQAIGSDIGCGFSAISFASNAEPLGEPAVAKEVIRALYKLVPALKQRDARVRALPEAIQPGGLSDGSLARKGEREGAYQLGTLGRGNHFVELQRDVAGQLWLMVHSGSRAMGQFITDFHLAKAARSATGLQFLDLRTPTGRAYFSDMEWAVRYATVNRLAMMAQVTEALEELLGIRALQASYVDSPHNFARREEHFGTSLIVHRKSAASAQDGELGLVAGSMGAPSYVVSGRGNPDSLCSSAHGAGRTAGRTEARQRIRVRDMQEQLGSVHIDSRNLDALRDEAPGAYRDIRKVMRAQQELIRQVHCLTPVLNFKYPEPR